MKEELFEYEDDELIDDQGDEYEETFEDFDTSDED